MAHFIQYIDAIWIFIALLIANRGQRLVAVGYVVACMLMMRMQIEFIVDMEYDTLLNLLPFPMFETGVITYSIFNALYLGFLQFSRANRGALLMASTISIFFVALIATSVVLVL